MVFTVPMSEMDEADKAEVAAKQAEIKGLSEQTIEAHRQAHLLNARLTVKYADKVTLVNQGPDGRFNAMRPPR